MKNNKWLIGAIVTTSAIVTVVPMQNSVEAAGPINQIIYTKNSENLGLAFDYFTEALNAGVLSELQISYVKLSDGKFYTFDNFTSALNVSDSVSAAVNMLSNSSFSESLTQVIPGQISGSGEIINPGVAKDFKVLSIE